MSWNDPYFTDRTSDFRNSLDDVEAGRAATLILLAVWIFIPLCALGMLLLANDAIVGFISWIVPTLVMAVADPNEGLPPISPYHPFDDLAPNDPIGTNSFGPLRDKMEKNQ
jgi:hypothetical protein